MDGVLIDSRPSMEIAWIDVCQKFELNIPFADYIAHVGLPFEDILHTLEVDMHLYAPIKHLYGRSVIKNHNNIRVYRGITSLLSKLTKSNKLIGIVTSKEFWRAEIIIDNFLFASNILITPEHVKYGKPNPEPILKAIESLNVHKKDTLYLGDMRTDCEAAISAGVDYIHCNWGYGNTITGMPCISYPEELLEIII